jgi:hypothetical protein
VTATVERSTVLDADAGRVWSAMCHPASFLYVCRGLLGWPALSGRTDPVREGERGSGWLFLFHVVPLYRHHIHVVRVDAATRTIESDEHGGPLRSWRHTLHVEPLGPGRSRYTDRIVLDAGPATPVAAAVANAVFGYRQRRWHRLARRHLGAYTSTGS